MSYKYRALVVITLASAIVKLSDEQARRRAPMIEKSKEHKGFYDILKPIQFKAGEEFETVDQLPKVYWHQVEWLNEPKSAKPKDAPKDPPSGKTGEGGDGKGDGKTSGEK
jgi:hypothetical protein